MKYMQLTLLTAMSMMLLLASPVRADGLPAQDYSQLAIAETRFEFCGQQKPPAYAKVREAIHKKQYDTALESLGEPGKSTKDSNFGVTNYLYGKILYLQAYQRVYQREAEQPDLNKLSEAKKYISLAAKSGFPEAIYDQAMLLTPPADSKKKLELLKAAADKKFVPAMLTLAEEYFHATKTFEDRLEAQALVQQAASIDTAAKIKLASYYLHEEKPLNNLTGYDKDIGKAITLLYEAAVDCDASAAYKLFQMSASEHKPNDLPTERGIYWLETSAKLGLAKAQGELAEHYYQQVKDSEKATYWALLAAEKGDLKALMTMGKIYYQGVGLEKNYSKALEYYEQALSIDTQNRLVLNQLGIMYYKGEGSEVDFRKAASLCEQAAIKGQAGCQYYLGLMYVNGEGVTQDIDTGISWMKKSAAQDFPVAKNWLRENW